MLAGMPGVSARYSFQWAYELSDKQWRTPCKKYTLALCLGQNSAAHSRMSIVCGVTHFLCAYGAAVAWRGSVSYERQPCTLALLPCFRLFNHWTPYKLRVCVLSTPALVIKLPEVNSVCCFEARGCPLGIIRGGAGVSVWFVKILQLPHIPTIVDSARMGLY